MCYNTGYGDHVVEMVKEVVSGYPVAGLFLDCMAVPPCVGVECIQEMKQRNMGWNDPKELRNFANFSRVRMAQRIADAANKIKSGLLLYFNGVNYEDQQDIGTYLEFECLPTGGWGYELLPVGARYLRTLKKPVLNMTGRFHRGWGDFGGLRTEASLEYDCLYGIANGMRTTIGDHCHPRGDINYAAFGLYKRIYDRLQKLEPWIDGAKPLTDIAVVNRQPSPETGTFDPELHIRNVNAVKGATRILCELKQQFDVTSDMSDWQGYKLLILPDFIELDAKASAKIRKHLDAGGMILSTAWSGLNTEKSEFVFNDWGIRFQGNDPFDPAYISVGKQIAEGIPDMPVTLYERGTAIEPLKGTQILAEIVAPYYSKHWDGEHGFLYLPPDKTTGRAAVTLNEKVAHISHPVFITYYKHAPVPMKQIVSNLLGKLLAEPVVKTTGMPSFARVTVTSQENRRMVHILSYVPERRGENIDMIEEPIELREVSIALRLDGRKPERVYLAPTEQELPFKTENGYIQITVPSVNGYTLIVFE